VRVALALTLLAACASSTVASAGSLTAVAPSGATPGITIQISGTGLSTVAAENEITFLPATGSPQSLPASSVTILDAATGRGRVLVKVPAGLPVGPAALRVTNRATGETSEGRTLQVLEIDLGAVRSAKADGSTAEIEISGSSNAAFVAGATRVVLGTGISVNTVTVDSPTRLRATITVARGAVLGSRTVAFNTSQQMGTLPDAFTVLAAPANAPPVANANGPYGGPVGADIAFSSAGSSDPDNDPITFEWTFGDGSSSTAPNPSHRYAAPGAYDVVLTVRDNQGNATSSTTKANVSPVANQKPVADAGGPYAGLTGQPVAFSGLGSKDPDGDLLIFAWDFGDGSSGIGPSPDHAYGQPGIYTVTLLVSDGKGGTDTAGTIARVSTPAPGNQPPRAAIGGPYTVTVNEPLTLSAAGSSDPDNDTLAYAWTFGDGDAGTGLSPVHTYQAVGTYTAIVLVTDGRGGSDTAQAEVVVTPVPAPQNQPPVARAGDDVQARAGVMVRFDGSASSDPDNDPLTLAWSFGDGGSAEGPTPEHAYAEPGTYTVTLLVTDGRGGAATDTLTVTVTVDQSNRPPTASISGPTEGLTNESLAFSAVASDPDNDPLTYAWDFEDGVGDGAAVTHAWPLAGKYTVRLTVTDGRGGVATANQQVSITAPPTPNNPPVADAGGPYDGQQNTPVTFDGSRSSDPDNDPLTFAWSFGDSGSGTGAKPSHAYAQAGTYTVTLVVSDPSGATSTATAQVVVTGTTPVNRAPTARPGGPYTTSTGVGVPFDGSASSDPDNDTLTFSWDFGDQSPKGSGPSPVHPYLVPNVYTVTLTVTDPSGASDSATTTVTISAPADRSPPNVTLSAPKLVLPGAQVTATARAVDDVAVSSVRFEVENDTPSDTSLEPFQRTFSVPRSPRRARRSWYGPLHATRATTPARRRRRSPSPCCPTTSRQSSPSRVRRRPRRAPRCDWSPRRRTTSGWPA
jgi:PKD repeat protein